MTTAVKTGNRVDQIQIAGGEVFEGSRWREAILAYLNGIWSNDVAVTHRPKINFNNTVLRLDGEKYIGYYSLDPDSGDLPSVEIEDMLIVPNLMQAEVENAMVRFVRNNQIRQLLVFFPSGKGSVVLTKGRKRSELFVTTAGLPSITDAMRGLYV